MKGEECLTFTKKFSPEFNLDVRDLKLGPLTNLYGKNGSGKTSLLKVLAGLILPDSAIIKLDRSLAFYFHDQDIGLFSHVNGLKNLELFLSNSNSLQFHYWKKNCSLFEKALLTPVESMSLGMRKIIKLFLFFNLEAKFLLLDEVFSNFDEQTSRFLLELMKNQSKEGKFFLISGHSEREDFLNVKIEEGEIVN